MNSNLGRLHSFLLWTFKIYAIECFWCIQITYSWKEHGLKIDS